MPTGEHSLSDDEDAVPGRTVRWWAIARSAVLGALTLLLSACGDDRPSCLPPVSPDRPITPPIDAPPRPGPVRLYLDGSGSMRGFVGNTGPSPYREVAHAMLGSLRRSASEFEVFRFAAGIERRDYSDRLAADILDASFYSSKPALGANPKQIPAGETHLHDVLKQAAAQPTVTTVVVTDLFLSAAEVHGGENSPLRQALADILHKGMSIALVGIQAPFTGRIYDLATTRESIKFTNGQRPFYILLIGNDAQVRTLYATLQAEVLGTPVMGPHHSTFFSPRALPASGWVPRLELNTGTREATLLAKSAASEAPFQIAVGRRGGGASIALERQDGDSAWFAGQAVVPDVRRATLKNILHFYTTGRHGCENGWVEDDERPGLVELGQVQPDRLSFNVMREPAATFGFRPKVAYVLDTTVTFPSLHAAPEARQWIKDWSYDATHEAALLKRVAQREEQREKQQQVQRPSAKAEPPSSEPILFPTLNLESLGDLMVQITKDQHSSERIHAFRLVYNME